MSSSKPAPQPWRQQWQHFTGFVAFVFKRVQEGRCLQVASSLSFTTLLALVPFITIALALLTPFDVFSSASLQIKKLLLANLLPESAGKVISIYMRQFTDNAERLTMIGVVVLAFTAMMMISTIDRAFAAIWYTDQRRPLWQRMMLYWTLLTLAPLGIGLVLNLIDTFIKMLPHLSGAGDLGMQLFKWVSRMSLSIFTLTMLFHFAPNRSVSMRHAFIGAAFTGGAFELLRVSFGVYVKKLASFKLVYGAFASLPIFLAWLYLIWSLLLIGATLTACLPYWHAAAWRRRSVPGRWWVDAVKMLLRLDAAHKIGEGLSTDQLRRHVGCGPTEASRLLAKLAQAGWVARRTDQKWILGQDLTQLQLVAVYRALVWEADPDKPIKPRQDPFSLAILPVLEGIEAPLNRSVASLLTTEPPIATRIETQIETPTQDTNTAP